MASAISALPEELILRVFNNLERLDDFYAVMLTSKQFHRISLDVKPGKISQLALHSANYFPALRPLNHFLLAGSARGLSDWARGDKGHEAQLKTAIHGGISELTALALEAAPIGLEDIRATYAWRREIVVPISRRLEFTCGPSTRDEDNGHLTVCENLDLALFTWAIYGELFDHILSPARRRDSTAKLDSITRFKFLVYCVPDVNSFQHLGLEKPQWFQDMDDSGGEKFQQLSLQHAMVDKLGMSEFAADVNQLTNLFSLEDDFREPDTTSKASLFVLIVMNSGRRSLEVLQMAWLAKYGRVDDASNTVAWLRELWALMDETMGLDGVTLPPTGDTWLSNHAFSMARDLQFTLWIDLQYDFRNDDATTGEDAETALRKAIKS